MSDIDKYAENEVPAPPPAAVARGDAERAAAEERQRDADRARSERMPGEPPRSEAPAPAPPAKPDMLALSRRAKELEAQVDALPPEIDAARPLAELQATYDAMGLDPSTPAVRLAPPPDAAAAIVAPARVPVPVPMAPPPPKVPPETAAERYAREAREANAPDLASGKMTRPKGGSLEAWSAAEAERRAANRPPTAEEYAARMREKGKGRPPGRV